MAFLAVAALVGQAGAQALPAFSGAEGAGATASGGRGYQVYHVTNLNDSGLGSFRDAVSVGNRIVVFDVGGTIKLGPDPTTNELKIRVDNLTIAGQTAPGDGIFIYGQSLTFGDSNSLDCHNVIVRNLHVRAGEDPYGRAGDSMNVNGTDVVVDHCSLEWASDELLSGWHVGYNNTVQYNIVSEALNYGGHGYGSLVGSDEANVVLSYHHNLYAHDISRCPRLGNENHAVNTTDWRNNVMYDWSSSCGYSSGSGGGNYAWGNFVNNYYIAGNSTSSGQRGVAFNGAGTFTHIYQSGNKIDANLNGVFDGNNTGWGMFTGTYVKETSELAVPAVYTQTADDSLQTVLNYSGANWWSRDSVDARIVNDVRAGTGTVKNWMTDVGGLTYYPEANRSAGFDTDQDGMPNTWEIAHGLNPNVNDSNGDYDSDGYTNIEEYINELAAFPAPKPIVWNGGGAGRYELISNWDIPWQPSLLDRVEINSGKASVGYIGQTAGTIYVGKSAGGTGELAMTAGGLTLGDSLRVGAVSGGRGTVDLSGGLLKTEGKLYVGSAGAGTFVQTGGSCRADGGVVIADAVGSTGRYELNGGTLSTPQLSEGSGNGVFHFTGGTLHADEVKFSLTNEGGVLAPGNSIGTTHVFGDLSMGGVTEIELGSLISFDKIIVDGLANLDGNLDIKLIDGYVPLATDTWKILSAGSFAGHFDSITSGFTVETVGGDLVLAPIPEPATLTFLAASAGLAVRLRRRRFNRLNVAFIGLLATVLACASVTQAAVINKYDFNSLATGPINGQSGGNVTWKSISANANVFVVAVDPNDSGNRYVDSNKSALQEQTVGTMTNPATVPSIFNLSATDRLLRISFTSRMNYASGGMVGIWVDGIDSNVNSMKTTNEELVCQFGMSGAQWRVRDANSSKSTSDGNGMPMVDGVMPWMKIILDVNLDGNSGNGIMSLSVVDLGTGVTTLPPKLQNLSMSLLSQNSRLGDPTKWTGWWFRGQQAAAAANPAVCPWGYTIDNLTLETIPEPTTISLLVLGILACACRNTRRTLVGEKPVWYWKISSQTNVRRLG